MASLPLRFLTPFPLRPSRRLRNSPPCSETKPKSPLPPFGLSVGPVQAQTSSAARGSLEGRFGKAKPSMVTSALPNLALNPVHIKWKTTVLFYLSILITILFLIWFRRILGGNLENKRCLKAWGDKAWPSPQPLKSHSLLNFLIHPADIMTDRTQIF